MSQISKNILVFINILAITAVTISIISQSGQLYQERVTEKAILVMVDDILESLTTESQAGIITPDEKSYIYTKIEGNVLSHNLEKNKMINPIILLWLVLNGISVITITINLKYLAGDTKQARTQ